MNNDLALFQPLSKLIPYLLNLWIEQTSPRKPKVITKIARENRYKRLAAWFKNPLNQITIHQIKGFICHWEARGIKKEISVRYIYDLSRIFYDLEIVNEDNPACQFLYGENVRYEGPGKRFSQPAKKYVKPNQKKSRTLALKDIPQTRAIAPTLFGDVNEFPVMCYESPKRKRSK